MTTYKVHRISKDTRFRPDKFARLMSCEMKKRFTTFEDASKTNNRVYPCDYCQGYHTTHLQR